MCKYMKNKSSFSPELRGMKRARLYSHVPNSCFFNGRGPVWILAPQYLQYWEIGNYIIFERIRGQFHGVKRDKGSFQVKSDLFHSRFYRVLQMSETYITSNGCKSIYWKVIDTPLISEVKLYTSSRKSEFGSHYQLPNPSSLPSG